MEAANALRGWARNCVALVAIALLAVAMAAGCSSGGGDMQGGSGWTNPLNGAPEPGTTATANGAPGADASQGSVTSGNQTGAPSTGATGADASTAGIDGSAPGSGNPGAAIHWLVTTADLNLRTGPSTSYSILRVIPKGSLVQLLDPKPVNGFLHVDHQGLTGWASSAYLVAQSTGGDGGTTGAGSGGVVGSDAGGSGADGGSGQPLTPTIQSALDRAKAGVGFSYWWAHGVWLPTGPTTSNAGSCSGSCPNCTHTGSYGADCSGYVGKIWQVPASNNDITVDSHPYSTADFVNDTSLWSTIPQGSVKVGDAFVYNQGGNGHIFLFAAGDPWGAMDVYECKGCSTGCVFDNRTAGSAYHSIRRAGY